jgi:hypothetical protein
VLLSIFALSSIFSGYVVFWLDWCFTACLLIFLLDLCVFSLDVLKSFYLVLISINLIIACLGVIFLDLCGWRFE